MNPDSTTEEASSFSIKTPLYEGPFGLLLGLVEKRKLFINDLSLAQVTEDYLGHINSLGKMHPAEASSFILVAATLILIKSKSLLPNLSLTSEEEGDISALEERLRLYELYTKLGINIKDSFGQKIIFAPLERKSEVLVFLPDEQITRESMMAFARGALGRIPKPQALRSRFLTCLQPCSVESSDSLRIQSLGRVRCFLVARSFLVWWGSSARPFKG